MIYKWITSGTKYQQLHYFVATATRVGSHFMVITRNVTHNYCNVKFKIMRKYVVFLLMKKDRIPTLWLLKNSTTFSAVSKTVKTFFPGPSRSLRMFKYKDKQQLLIVYTECNR